MQLIQLDFFQTKEESEMDFLKKQIESIAESGNKVRKGTYGKIGELTKIIHDLNERLLIIEKNICKS